MKRLLVTIIAGIVISLSAFVTVSAGDVTVQLQIPIPGLGQSLPVCIAHGTDLECTGIAQYIAFMYRWLVGIAAVLAVLALTWGGVRWLTSAGESDAIQDAKKIMGNAIIGLVISFCSYTLLWAINSDLVQFNPLRIQAVQAITLDFESVEKYGEETGDAPKPGEEELHFGDEGEEYTEEDEQSFNDLRLWATPVYAKIQKKNFKNTGTLASLDQYIKKNIQFRLVKNRCLAWTRISLESIFGEKKIKETAIYPRLEYPAATAHQFEGKGMYVRSRSLAGIRNGDVVFMKLATSFLVARGVDKGPGGDSISHIGVHYNGSIYHQFGERLSKDTVEKGILKGRRSRDGKPVEITGYGRMGL